MKVEQKVVSEEEKQKSKKQATDKGKVVLNHPPVQHLPYLHAPSKKDKARQCKRFLDIFKWLPINIPFSKALEQMPTYAKFMKDLLTKKRRIMDDETGHPYPPLHLIPCLAKTVHPLETRVCDLKINW